MIAFRSAACSGVAVLVAMLLLGVPSTVPAQTTDDPSPHSEATLLTAAEPIAPGEPFTVGLRIRMEDGWHSYWKNPGDSGEPASIDWSLPEAFSTETIQWPYPHRIPFGPMTSYGYSDEVVLPVTITPPETLTPGTTVTLKGDASWLICADICLPAEASLNRSVPVASAAGEGPGAASISGALDKQPENVEGWTVQAARSSGSYTLALTPPSGRAPSLEGAYFFPAEKEVLDHAAPQPVTRAGDTYLLTLQQSDYADAPADTLTGVVVAPEGTHWDAEGTVRALRMSAPVDSTLAGVDMASVTAAASSGDGGLTLPWALLFAFAGGLLLNLMPCVFPVLSVKILGFAEEAGGTDAGMRRHGALFGAGVLASMWGLAGVLLAVRAAGSQVGWGFQLQSPTFVALMALLFFSIGLNLLGVFEVGSRLMALGGRLQSRAEGGGDVGAFLTGGLATVVATPCTAPFMGAALGVALTLSTPGAVLIFTALGVGMATPYVALSMVPGWLERLPEPGAWMETLKQLFAFPMFATAIWLVWVFGQQVGNGGVALLLAGGLLLGIAGWVAHRWSDPMVSGAVAWGTRVVVTLMVVGAVAAGVIGARYDRSASAGSEATSSSSSSSWTSFSTSTVEKLREQGRPVFVDFTAAWCLTCQVNKQTVLGTDAVQKAFAKRDVALVRADWTNRDPQITKALRSHGRSGVPLYVLYPGDGSGPTLLPEVLTQDIVLNALDDLPSSS
ncbi:MAG: thiol:disulfide interchange protein [Bacteroidetes bacterium SW_9_63_38]|nr:MAG: thiol:disulfide interchange protein [Bacteroidetes bacterium SW_9_63_38]